MNMMDAAEYGFCLTYFDDDDRKNNLPDKYNQHCISDFDSDTGSIVITFDNLKIKANGTFSSQMFLTFCYARFNMTYEEGLEYVKLFSFNSPQLMDNIDSSFIMNGSSWNGYYKFLFDIDDEEDVMMYAKLKYPNAIGNRVKSKHG